jgi:hypothetical protein
MGGLNPLAVINPVAWVQSEAVNAASGGDKKPSGETQVDTPYDPYPDMIAASTELGYASLAVSEEMAAAQLELAAKQAEIAERQQAMSEEQYRIWKVNYLPLEREIVQAAGVGIDPGYYAGRAAADVNASFDKAGEVNTRNMARMGIDASSGRFAQMDAEMEIARAAAEAGASTQARNVVADTNYQRKMNAASIGRNIPSTAASMSANAANTYGSAAGTQRGAAATSQQGYSTAIGATMGAANMGLDAQQFNAQMNMNQQQIDAQNKAALYNGLGQIAGTAGGLAIACWVAREVYGADNPKWLMFRHWLLNKAPVAFRAWYLAHGPAVAEWIRDRADDKARVRRWMDAIISNETAAPVTALAGG